MGDGDVMLLLRAQGSCQDSGLFVKSGTMFAVASDVSLENDRSLEGRVVVITGASAGVGRACAIEFARLGAKVALLGREKAALEETLGEVAPRGEGGAVFDVDISDAARLAEVADQIEETLGPIYVWVNNAMVSAFGRVTEIMPEEFERVMQVTYLGTVYGSQLALLKMRAHGEGRIIQVGSALAYRGIPLQAAYCAAKHAVQGFTDSLRSELLHDKSPITVSMVQLPALNTPQFDWVMSRLPNKPQPVPPIYQPEVAARGIAHMALHPRRELMIGSSTVIAIWGNKFFPGLGDRYLAHGGIDSQQTDAPEDPRRPNNLWTPVRDKHRTHGRFDESSKSHSTQLWLTLHRSLLAAFVGVIAILALTLWTLGFSGP